MNIEEMEQHILNDIVDAQGNFQTGTEIYLLGLYQPFQSIEYDIYSPSEMSRQSRSHTNTSVLDEMMIEDINHSLLTFLKYAYIDFPSNVNLTVNGKQVMISNPFSYVNGHVASDENSILEGQGDNYKYWIIT